MPVAFDFSHQGHALVTLYVQFLCCDWSKFDRWVHAENLCSVLKLVYFDSWSWQSFVNKTKTTRHSNNKYSINSILTCSTLFEKKRKIAMMIYNYNSHFLALKVCLVYLKLPLKIVFCSNDLWSSSSKVFFFFSSHWKLLVRRKGSGQKSEDME